MQIESYISHEALPFCPLALAHKEISLIARQARVYKMADYIQHGTTTTLAHVAQVAHTAVKLANALPGKTHYRELVRGAMLHDYYLYDWHTDAPDRWHGFTHPGHALRQALADFTLTKRERDIIKHHMFPLVPSPPRSREAWLVTLADKIVATKETIKRR